MRSLFLVLLFLQDGSDVVTIRDRWIDSLIPKTEAGIQKISNLATTYMDNLRPNGSWPDCNYADRSWSGWQPRARHLTRMVTMARAHRISPSDELRDRTLDALDFWLANDFRSDNWIWNEVWTPYDVGLTLLLMQPVLREGQLAKGLKVVQRSTDNVDVGHPETWTAVNLIWRYQNNVLWGCLVKNAGIVDAAFEKIFGELRIVAQGQNGIQADWSFHQHGPLLYSGGYGKGFAEVSAEFVHLARGTAFACPASKIGILSSYILDGQQWMIREGTYDYGIIGRAFAQDSPDALREVHPYVSLLSTMDLPRRDEFADFAGRLKGVVPPLSGNRHFWKSDFMTHQRPGYYASARMFSRRTLNTDKPHGNRGTKSHHLSDGATYIFQRGDEYANVFPCWDWRKVPGTTVEQGTSSLDPKLLPYYGSWNFVGGASDGTYGLAAMNHVAGKMGARKAWFFFDDEFVCLGAGIYGGSENSVATTVNQCLLKGSVETSRGILPQGLSHLPNVPWVLHDSIGYVFPKGGDLYVRAQTITGRWGSFTAYAGDGVDVNADVQKPVFKFWIHHGVKPSGAKYAYIVVPGKSSAEVAAYAQNPPIEVLSNSSVRQAVRHRGLKILQIVFVKPGTQSGVTVDQPCLLMLNEETGRVTVSNPFNAPIRINVAVGERSLVFNLTGGKSVTQ